MARGAVAAAVGAARPALVPGLGEQLVGHALGTQ